MAQKGAVGRVRACLCQRPALTHSWGHFCACAHLATASHDAAGTDLTLYCPCAGDGEGGHAMPAALWARN